MIYHELLLKELSKLDFESVLDVGCGDLWLAYKLVGKDYMGFDLPTDLNGELPYESFDLVVSAAVLCTMRDISKAVENIKRIAKKHIVLVEFDGEPKDYSTGDGSSVRIMRDYNKEFGLKFKKINIPKEVWPGEGWQGEAPGKILIWSK